VEAGDAAGRGRRRYQGHGASVAGRIGAGASGKKARRRGGFRKKVSQHKDSCGRVSLQNVLGPLDLHLTGWI
jgi:hypothetical protein